MIGNIQSIMSKMGAAGCYAFSLLKVAELVSGKDIDATRAYVALRDENIIRPDCFVNDAAKVLERYAPGGWVVRKEPAAYQPTKDEFEILYFERAEPGVVHPHFVLGDGGGNVAWDPWEGSLTVKFGQLKSKRICWRAS